MTMLFIATSVFCSWVIYLLIGKFIGNLLWDTWYSENAGAKDTKFANILFPPSVCQDRYKLGKRSCIAQENNGFSVYWYDDKTKFVAHTAFVWPIKAFVCFMGNIIPLLVFALKALSFPLWFKLDSVDEASKKIADLGTRVRVAVARNPKLTPEDELTELLAEQERIETKVRALKVVTGTLGKNTAYR